MKKIFTLILALVAIVGTASAEKVSLTPCAPNAWWGSKCVGWGTVDFSSQWGEFKVAQNVDITAYKGVKVQYKDAANAQFKIVGSVSGDDLYAGLADGEGTATKEFTFTGGSTSCTVELQGTEAGGHVTIVAASLIKADGTEEALTDPVGTSWGCTYGTNNIMFTDNGGEIGFKETIPSPAAGQKIKIYFECSSNKFGYFAMKVLVPETSAAVASGLASLSDYDQKYYAYGNDCGVLDGSRFTTEQTFDFEFTTITFMAKESIVGGTLSRIVAAYELISDTGVESVSADNAAATAVKTLENGKLVIKKNGKTFNAAGQLMK